MAQVKTAQSNPSLPFSGFIEYCAQFDEKPQPFVSSRCIFALDQNKVNCSDVFKTIYYELA